MTNKLNIAIVGYGKMGREIEKHALAAGDNVVAVIDNPQDWEDKQFLLKQADVAIEFTSPVVVLENLKKLADLNIAVITGTTGWYQHLPEIREYFNKSNASLFYASNFSIGVNLFFALNRYLAQLMKNYPEYAVTLSETHHVQKLDAPSGTAITMVDDLQQNHPGINGWEFADQSPQLGKVPITAHRIAGVTGTHELAWESEIDSIMIRHTAHNRDGFARGALMAAHWLKEHSGVFTMTDLLKI
jgi:4-hydroxy-tetrahydrodipicolinate reductase